MDEIVFSNELNTSGNHETEVSEQGEGDLHRQLIKCKKNPGHAKFLPMETFRLHHLPEAHRSSSLFEYIRSVADLTVRISVNTISSNRPQFWPNTNEPYPFHNTKKQMIRCGTGEVYNVIKFDHGQGYDVVGRRHQKKEKHCVCDKCKDSESAKSVWWEIEVLSATHVVFDESESRHSSCRFFYDCHNSSVYNVNTVSVFNADISRDLCRVRYITCESEIGDKLFMMWVTCRQLCKQIVSQYKQTRDEDKLVFIVSHPHGCTKQVSIGHWIDKRKMGEFRQLDLSKMVYTASTCPGSSGATVHCVGYIVGTHVHCGALDSELNYSGVGWVSLK